MGFISCTLSKLGAPQRNPTDGGDFRNKAGSGVEWVVALLDACFRGDENIEGYLVPPDSVIEKLLAEGLSEWLPTKEAVQKWYEHQAGQGRASSASPNEGFSGGHPQETPRMSPSLKLKLKEARRPCPPQALAGEFPFKRAHGKVESACSRAAGMQSPAVPRPRPGRARAGQNGSRGGGGGGGI